MLTLLLPAVEGEQVLLLVLVVLICRCQPIDAATTEHVAVKLGRNPVAEEKGSNDLVVYVLHTAAKRSSANGIII